MEYVKIVSKELVNNKIIAGSIVMPKVIGELLYLTQLVSPIQEVLNCFSTTELVNCKPEEYNSNNFLLFMQFKNGELSEEEFYEKLEK